jgi:hypothetical protein
VSDDELWVLMTCAIVAVVGGMREVRHVLGLSTLHVGTRTRALVAGTLVVCAVIVQLTLSNLASFDVQGSFLYTFFYDVMGLAWLVVLALGLHGVGLSLRDDVLERRNDAALAAWSGAMIGGACAFAGGNVGDGPGWWCVVFAGGLASALLLGSWVLMHHLGGLHDHVTIDRDLGAGARAGALLLGVGLIGGRAAAGTWFSFADTTATFVAGAWPALVIVACAIAVERTVGRGPSAVSRRVGSLFALAYLGAALAVVLAPVRPE